MASPQLKNGYTRISNEILEKLSYTHLSPNQSKVIWFVIRKTYGWQKKKDFISLNQFVEGTKLRKSHICRALSELVKRKIVIKTDNKMYGFQADWEQWRFITNSGNKFHQRHTRRANQEEITNTGNASQITSSGNAITSSGNNETSKDKSEANRRTSKETITKETNTKEINNTEPASPDTVNNKGILDEIIKSYNHYHPEARKLYGVGAIIKAREFFDGCLILKISKDYILKRIKETEGNGIAPWEIINTRTAAKEHRALTAEEKKQGKESYRQMAKIFRDMGNPEWRRYYELGYGCKPKKEPVF